MKAKAEAVFRSGGETPEPQDTRPEPAGPEAPPPADVTGDDVTEPEEQQSPYSIEDAPPAEWVMMTPAQARDALRNMRRNRKIRQARVDAIARDITGRKWRRNGDTVKRGTDGKWEDGQHRFTAISQANMAVPMLVVTGVEMEARTTIDSGAARTYADRLRMGGQTGSEVTASMVRRLYRWDVLREYIYTSRSYFISTEELEAYRMQIAAELERGREIAPLARLAFLTPTYLGVITVILSRVDQAAAAQFLNGLIYGTEMRFDNPIMALRRRLQKESSADARSQGGANSETKMAMVFTAWRLWREGKTATVIQLPRGRLTNKNYPLPY